MGFIKEPEGVDFIINSKSTMIEDEKIISEYIKKDKDKREKIK